MPHVLQSADRADRPRARNALVRVEWFDGDDLATLSSLDPQLTVDDLIAEFQLTPHPDYIRRAQQAQDERRPTAE